MANFHEEAKVILKLIFKWSSETYVYFSYLQIAMCSYDRQQWKGNKNIIRKKIIQKNKSSSCVAQYGSKNKIYVVYSNYIYLNVTLIIKIKMS